MMVKRNLVTEYEGHFGPFFQREAARHIPMFEAQAHVESGVVRWNSNNRVPPNDILELWAHVGKPFNLKKSKTVSQQETEAALAEYQWQRAQQEYTAEEIMEMEAAFGPGAKVVNVLTGQSIQL